MNDTNFYQKLKENYSTFNATLNLDDRQQESLKPLLVYTEGALSSYRSEVEKLRADAVYSDEEKKKRLAEHKTKLAQTLSNEFKHVQDRLTDAKNKLYNATHEAKAKDTTEELLRHMKGAEVRNDLGKMPLAKRVEILINTAQNGDPSVLRAVKAQPITADLIPSDVLDRADQAYASKVAPEQSVSVSLAEQDLDGAQMIQNLTQVEIGHIDQGI